MINSNPRFIIHLGAPKTGSTALQKILTEHREAFMHAGLLYPQTALRGFGHHDIAFLLDGGFPDWAKPIDCRLEDFCRDLRSEINTFEGDVLLSSENFYLFPQPQALFDFLQQLGISQRFEIVLINYIRRQDEAVLSWYNQRVKAQGYTGTLEDSIEDDFDL